ncbi:hypothetical protein ES703_80323 [subsurface metagenome]
MPWSILTNPYAVMTIIVSVILLTVPVIPVEDTEISYTFEPYTFEQSLVREEQIRKFPWIHEVTRAQYLIKNTDINGGIFYINCIFDNEIDTDTKTLSMDILAGEQKAVTVDSSLKGKSSIILKVIPPKKSIPHETTVTKNVTTWAWLSSYAFR